jgi:cytoskeletal protein CcmA (bactofilin family)
MDKRNRQDLRISGTGTASGGYYNNVMINGEGDINGNLDCIDLRINGTSDIEGAVKTKTSRIFGRVKINGNLGAEQLKISGMLYAHGRANVEDLTIEGTFEGEDVSAESLNVKGMVMLKGDCNAENFVSKGGFNIGGLLNAGTIDIDLYGTCRAKEIGGEKITVRKGKVFDFSKIIKSILFSLHLDGMLTTDSIEADDIHLEFTKAKAVRGNNVFIGRGCEIGLVEYKTKFYQSEHTIVKENKRVGK